MTITYTLLTLIIILIGYFNIFKAAKSSSKEFPTVSQAVSTDKSLTGNLKFGAKYENN